MQNNLQSNLVQQKLRHIGTAHEAGLARPALCKLLHCDIIYSECLHDLPVPRTATSSVQGCVGSLPDTLFPFNQLLTAR